ncbi:hypothetical protein [Oceanobacillus sp. 1P07AA]|uniref:hypothetical protein n=1 Tax=Oceanobacillus sp. 1P07AA TaxID=3132293 RepID=UPI0039A539EB
MDKYSDEEHDIVKIVINGAPHNLKLHKNERKQVEIYTTIDVSRLEEAMDAGNMKMLNIRIETNGKENCKKLRGEFMLRPIIGISTLCLYCFPFVYFSMYTDFQSNLIVGYLIMVVSTAILAFINTFFRNSFIIILGNILSLMFSLYFTSQLADNDHWTGYFKPFWPYQLVILVTVLNLIPQLIAMKLSSNFKKKRE